MRIAIIGPFDIENFGDHIFKQVLEKYVKDSIPEAEFDPFALFGGSMGFSVSTSAVKSIDVLEECHLRNPYDALIVAGGSVIHFETLVQKLRGKKVAYPIWKLWTTASLVASKYDIKLLWNNPESPLSFEDWQGLVTEKFLEPVDFLSVRGIASRNTLQPYTDKKILVSPDTGWLLDEIYTDEVVVDSFPAEVPPAKNLALFHCNQRLSEKAIPTVIRVLKKLKRNGYTIVLLPLAYTNSEEEILEKVNKLSGGDFIYVNRPFSLIEMLSLFSKCRLYAGLSFHGAIAATIYGSEVVAFDYEKRSKTKELYSTLHKVEQYTTNPEDFETAINDYLAQDGKRLKKRLRIVDELQDKVREHFKDFCLALWDDSPKKGFDLTDVFRTADTETQKRFKDWCVAQKPTQSIDSPDEFLLEE